MKKIWMVLIILLVFCVSESTVSQEVKRGDEAAGYSDKVFGALVWESEYNWWSSTVEITPGRRVKIGVCGKRDNPAKVIGQAKILFLTIRGNERELREFAAIKLLDLSQEWNEGPEITRSDFIKKISIEAVTFYEEGGAEVYYNDGELFAGHTIIVRVAKDGKLKDALLGG